MLFQNAHPPFLYTWTVLKQLSTMPVLLLLLHIYLIQALSNAQGCLNERGASSCQATAECSGHSGFAMAQHA